VITKGDTGAVIELVDKTNKITALPPKISEAIFAVLAITSPDHAIDLIASATQSSRILASYVFAAPEHAKYLTQYISADASFVNHVPARLLLGPAAPQHVSLDVNQRYTVEHFTRAAPVFVSKPAGNDTAKNALDGNSKVISVLMKEAVAEIKEKKRPDWIAHGFFEQGIFIGLGVYGIPLVICIGAGLFYAVRFGVRRFM
jgi:aldehyde dehydrogenase (NAD+)